MINLKNALLHNASLLYTITNSIKQLIKIKPENIYSFTLTIPSTLSINSLNNHFKNKQTPLNVLRNKTWKTSLNIVKTPGKTRATESKLNYTYKSKEKQFQSANIVGTKLQTKTTNGDLYEKLFFKQCKNLHRKKR